MSYTWRELNRVLKTLTEDELAEALNKELDSRGNRDVAVRLHQRFSVVRRARERKLIAEMTSK